MVQPLRISIYQPPREAGADRFRGGPSADLDLLQHPRLAGTSRAGARLQVRRALDHARHHPSAVPALARLSKMGFPLDSSCETPPKPVSKHALSRPAQSALGAK